MRAVALGFSCNNACVFCAQGELRADDVFDDVAIDAEIQRTAPGETVAFVGGEPTLRDRLPEWVRKADVCGAGRVLLQTNARRLAYASYAGLLRSASARLSLDVSLHGATEAMHDYHTSVAGSFKQTVLGLRNARAHGLEAGATIVVTRSNFRHLSEIVRVAHACGVNAVHFAVAEAFGRAARSADRVVPSLELVKPHLLHALGEARRLGLGARVGDQASDGVLLERFAGIGEVEAERQVSPPAAALAPSGPRKVTLTVIGKPAPGRREERGPGRVTGAELRAIFPDLFSNAGRTAAELGPRPLSPEAIRALSKASPIDEVAESTPRAAGGRR